MNYYQEVEKNLGDRVQEFIYSLQIINDSVKQIRDGKFHQIIPIYGQLRALLTEKSKNNKPLLFDIAEKVSVSLEFYAMPDINDLSALLPKEGLSFHMSGFPLSINKELERQSLVSMRDFLCYEIVFFRGKNYCVTEIIDLLANKAGGAHYAPRVSQNLAELFSIALNGQSVLSNALLQIAEIIFALGVRILQQLSNFEKYLLVYIPEQHLEEPAFIEDNVYPQSSMRYFYRIDPDMKLVFGVVGWDRQYVLLKIQRIIEWSKTHFFRFIFNIDEQLDSHLTVYVDGELFGKAKISFPIFVHNHPLYYDTYWNRAVDNENLGLTMGVCEVLIPAPDMNESDKAEVFGYLMAKKENSDLPCVAFKKGGYALAKSGTKDFELTNSTRTTISAINSE